MDVYLSGCRCNASNEIARLAKSSQWNGCYLASYAYRDYTSVRKIMSCTSRLMLDSGAFTFLNGSKKTVDWDAYLREYAEFINENDIELFFELDIDPLVGYDQVKEMRDRLEGMTHKQCIPVWHKSRGRDEFLNLCSQYPYVALGGIAIGEIKRSEHRFFPWFINEAHKRGAKIHGLGYTNTEGLYRYHFDSVDSSSWLSGVRYGRIQYFNGTTMKNLSRPKGMRANTNKAELFCLHEWIKFQEYARASL